MFNVANTKESLISPSSPRDSGPDVLEFPKSGLRPNGDRSLIQTFAKNWLIEPFQPIGLKQLNAKAAMLERLDNKYVVRETALRQAVAELARHFDILEIDGKRHFTYETCYFDDQKNSSYFDHHRGRRQRFKVRVRKYTDAQLCFVEVKLKDKRGITVKKRLDYTVDKYGTLDLSAWAHIHSAYGDLYGRDFSYALEPVIEMRYQRITLVVKNGGERMTIDCRLVFSGADRSYSIDENTFIVETKSANGNGIADKILRGLHQHPTKHCSKYCVGMAILQEVQKYNKFLPVLRKLNAVPGSQHSDVMVVEHRSYPANGMASGI
jgi:hypothetical protein